MTEQSSEKYRALSRQASERGAILILASLVIVVLLAVIGLAVDAGNLYRARIWLQKSADAGALSGIGYAIYKGDGQLILEAGGASGVKSLIEQKALAATQANLRLLGLNPDSSSGNRLAHDIQVTPIYSPASAGNQNDVLNVTVAAKINFFILQFVPFEVLGVGRIGSDALVKAVAASQRRPANIQLVLDNSDSMNCPASGPCDCLGPNRSGPCTAPLKIEKLQEAVASFLDSFDPNRDRIGITSYSMAAQNEAPVNAAGGFDKAALNNAMNALTPGGNTNIADGLIKAYLDMRNLPATSGKAYVLVSDGNPTATRVLLQAPTTLPPWNPDGIGAYDYTHYTTQWVDTSSDYPGPSLLLQTGLLTAGYTSATPPAGSNPGAAPCSGATAPSNPTQFDSVFSSCLSNLSFHMPNNPTNTYGGPNDPSFADWRKLYSINAIQLTDFLRTERGTIYSIGIGSPAAVTSSDPYQGLDDTASRKDVFLSRAANDYLYGVYQSNDLYGFRHPEFSYTNYQGYDAWNSLPDRRQGSYLSTLDASGKNLEVLFRKIAVKIKLRLIL